MNLARTAMAILTEADVEAAALDWLAGVGWQVADGPDGAPETPSAATTVRWCWSGDCGTPSAS